jgi:hydrogenase nickel incorporation protein HypA/HybF
MHEYSVGQALMDRIDAEAAARHAISVHRVFLKIGEVSGVEPDLLASAFSILKERTICQNAELAIERVPARWVCPTCGVDIAAGAILRCRHCGEAARLSGGDEIVLAQLEMEVP